MRVASVRRISTRPRSSKVTENENRFLVSLKISREDENPLPSGGDENRQTHALTSPIEHTHDHHHYDAPNHSQNPPNMCISAPAARVNRNGPGSAAASTVGSLVKGEGAAAGKTRCIECDGYECCCIPIPHRDTDTGKHGSRALDFEASSFARTVVAIGS
ncbi:hypothetical protein B2J93_2107 [Marssonina coronariae]|uniref:Uncharacterized protein n=1 Tax=Diplocarpon coronariae TaxID=2795749 RepID=A0A218Z0J6_9HELO|nr:hypothetical protein B2J93_2107 [Marssonina coronariae]